MMGRGASRAHFELFPMLPISSAGAARPIGRPAAAARDRPGLAMQPRLILDEPTEGIQPSIIKEIERAIRALAATGEMAILLVEQYYDFARSLADQYLVMERGEIVARGAARIWSDGVKRSAGGLSNTSVVCFKSEALPMLTRTLGALAIGFSFGVCAQDLAETQFKVIGSTAPPWHRSGRGAVLARDAAQGVERRDHRRHHARPDGHRRQDDAPASAPWGDGLRGHGHLQDGG